MRLSNEFWVMKPKWNSAFEFVHPDDLAKAESLTEALLRPAVNIAAEFRLQHAKSADFEVIANNLLAEPSVAGIVTK